MNLSFLVVSWFLTFGYVPDMAGGVYGYAIGTENFTKIATVADIGIKITAYDNFSIYTSMANYQYPVKMTQFYPFSIRYIIGADYILNNNIKFNLEHKCQHPVVPNQKGDNIDFNYNYGETSLTVTFHGKLRL